MQLTPAGRGVLESASKLTEHDFEVREYNSVTGECCVVHYTVPLRPLAIHKGTTVETARMWKLQLITRRLTAGVRK